MQARPDKKNAAVRGVCRKNVADAAILLHVTTRIPASARLAKQPCLWHNITLSI